MPVSSATISRRTPRELVRHLVGGLEAVVGVGGRGAEEEPVERVVAGEVRDLLGGRQGEAVGASEVGESAAQHGERAGDGEEVGGDRRPGVGDLGRLVAGGAVDRAGPVVDPVHAAEVDELHRRRRAHHVVGLEVAEEQPLIVQVAQRREDLEHVGDGVGERERVATAVVGRPALAQQLAQADPVDVLHDDVAGAVVLDEVVDLDDVRVVDAGEEPALVERVGDRLRVSAVDHTLEDAPHVVDLAVPGEVDPAEPPVGEAAHDLVLPADDVAAPELRAGTRTGAAPRAEALGAAGHVARAAADRRAAARGRSRSAGARRPEDR